MHILHARHDNPIKDEKLINQNWMNQSTYLFPKILQIFVDFFIS